MKYTLTIEADSATELFDALVASATVYRLSDAAEPAATATPLPDYPHSEEGLFTGVLPINARVTLPTGDDPSDVYGPGNGPVGAHRPDADVEAPATDANNMPHDERIHAGSKALNADGTWRKKRGVSDELIRNVEAECITSTVSGLREVVIENEVSDCDNPSDAPTIVRHNTVETVLTTHTPASIMSRIAALVTSYGKTPTYVQEIVKSCDLADGIAQIASDSDALQRVVAALQADGVL